MTSIRIDDLDEDLAARLNERAIRHGRSVQEEALTILRTALAETSHRTGADLADSIRAKFAPFGPFDLDIPPREPARDPLRFDE